MRDNGLERIARKRRANVRRDWNFQQGMALNILFAVHDWGLGHATRDLLLIRALVAEGHNVYVVSTGRALQVLKQELGEDCEFLELRDIPKPLARYPWWFYVKMTASMPKVFRTFREERRYVDTLCRIHQFDCIVSDSRFGMCHPQVPSYYIFHSLRQIIPGRPRRLEAMVEASQQRLLRHADRILVPDQRHDGLAGDLCHRVSYSWRGRVDYIGILSSISRTQEAEDIDYFISVSGAEPQRSYFEQLVLQQAPRLPGRVVIALGRPDSPVTVTDDGRVAVYSYMDRWMQENVMNRARLVVTRSGYTTLMELAELGKRALLIPTPGQSEQEYLADFHRQCGHLYSVRQSQLSLARDVGIAETYPGLPHFPPTNESIQRFLSVLAPRAGELAMQRQSAYSADYPD